MKNLEKLLIKTEIKSAFDNGEVVFSPYFVCYITKSNKTNKEVLKYLIIASKKVGNAVERHRAKRICRVAVREVSEELRKLGISNIILISKRRILELKSDKLREVLLKKLKK